MARMPARKLRIDERQERGEYEFYESCELTNRSCDGRDSKWHEPGRLRWERDREASRTNASSKSFAGAQDDRRDSESWCAVPKEIVRARWARSSIPTGAIGSIRKIRKIRIPFALVALRSSLFRN